ncbi:hypothetical protein GCM10029976_005230 [Kribbella albertanoniae]
MPAANRRFVAGGTQLLEGVVPDTLQQNETATRLDRDQAPLGEVGQNRLQVRRLEVLAAHDLFGGLQRAAADEDGHPVQNLAADRIEERAAPVDRRTETGVPSAGRAHTADEQPQPILDPHSQLLDAQRPGQAGREFDGQRKPVDRRTDLVDQVCPAVRCYPAALPEQPSGSLTVEGTDGVHLLADHANRLL